MTQQETKTKTFLTASQVRRRYGNASHMWLERRLQSDPDFPRPLRIGTSLYRLFDLAEIEAYEKRCATHLAERVNKPPPPRKKLRSRAAR